MRCVALATVLAGFIAFYLSGYTVESRASYLCSNCVNKEECDREPEEFCFWGVERDGCNRKVCAKGPGERCGGPHNLMGICGAGMWCHTDEDHMDRCHGCFPETLECYRSP